MTFQVSLNIATMIMCVVTLTVASLALMPQIKQGMVIVRDTVLWVVLLAIVAVVGVVGWSRLHQAQQRRAGPASAQQPGWPEHGISATDRYAAGHRRWQPNTSHTRYPDTPSRNAQVR